MELKKSNRRAFISSSAKGSVAAIIGASAVGSFLQSCSATKATGSSVAKQFAPGFDQSALPYGYDAIEPVIDARTMEIHYTKHAAAYSKALKEAAAAEGANDKNLVDILQNVSKYSEKMRNNAGGHYNHEMFWKSLRRPNNDNVANAALLSAIEEAFGSFGNFKLQFAEAASKRFGSGWAWLYVDDKKQLKIGSTPNQDNPLMNVSEVKGFPLLGLDVWEHAYYLKYQNKRADYIDGFWKVVNWQYVLDRYMAAK